MTKLLYGEKYKIPQFLGHILVYIGNENPSQIRNQYQSVRKIWHLGCVVYSPAVCSAIPPNARTHDEPLVVSRRRQQCSLTLLRSALSAEDVLQIEESITAKYYEVNATSKHARSPLATHRGRSLNTMYTLNCGEINCDSSTQCRLSCNFATSKDHTMSFGLKDPPSLTMSVPVYSAQSTNYTDFSGTEVCKVVTSYREYCITLFRGGPVEIDVRFV